MPEETNRRLTDHVSELLFCPTPLAVRNLRREGISRGVHQVGDVMVDALRQNLARAKRAPTALPGRGSFYLATLHRQENTDDPRRLREIVGALRALDRPVVLPLHPRTRERLLRFGVATGERVQVRAPFSYLEMLLALERAAALLTDSGGLQKEAFVLGTPCLTLRDTTEWPETLRGGRNVLTGADRRRILAAARRQARRPRTRPPAVYGDGRASVRIARLLERFLRAR
jgi:UDP-N-acetylglucosamine 2-epimerase